MHCCVAQRLINPQHDLTLETPSMIELLAWTDIDCWERKIVRRHLQSSLSSPNMYSILVVREATYHELTCILSCIVSRFVCQFVVVI